MRFIDIHMYSEQNMFCNDKYQLFSVWLLLQCLSFLYISNAVQNKSFAKTEMEPSINFLKSIYKTKSFRYLSIENEGIRERNKYSMRKSLHFLYYKDGNMLLRKTLNIGSSYTYISRSCADEKISFIFHGWTESCHTEWIPQLRERLTFHRGGCIICADYSSWSKKSYFQLLQKFNLIAEVFFEEVLQLIQIGFSPGKMFMFGFSYGGQIASTIGRRLKPEYTLNKLDICDMAGPGFDFLTYVNHSEAAENVQCYYTSVDKGSHFYSCHQNIRLGQCGYTQPAVLSQPNFGSHGLCVRMYINAFDFPFYTIQRVPLWCERNRTITNLPYGFTVGYRENEYITKTGDLFVPTSLNYPYNLSRRELILYEKYLGDV